MIRPGEPWGSPTSSPPDLEVTGGDTDLAAAVTAAEGALVRFHPDSTSDLARAVGLAPATTPETATGAGDPDRAATALPLDRLGLGTGVSAVNMCIFGVPPDRVRWSSRTFDVEIHLDGRPWFSGRATTVVVATGQFLRGLDVVPRGHPGDGKAEVQVYELRRRERRLMRARLATGSHVPHPGIRQRSARSVELRFRSGTPCEVDGTGRVAGPSASIQVVPSAYRLLV
jgi:YegS C-terminal NAD kinase beta sandwich-like domain